MSSNPAKPRGRPHGSTDPNAKRAKVGVRCLLREKGLWNRAARKAGISLSEWMRQAANQAAE